MNELKSHPFADAYPMFGEEELKELADSIAIDGLHQPITLYKGLILDGRNRYAACQRANTAPTFTEFEGDDDGALAFVIASNNDRRHQSKGSLAASWALALMSAGKRSDARWGYGNGQNSDLLNKEIRSRLGLIADFSPDLLSDIRDDVLTVNAAYEKAIAVRDAERSLLEEQERIEAEEDEARRFLEERGITIPDAQSARARKAQWESDNQKEAARIREQERKARQEQEQLRKNAYEGSSKFADALTKMRWLAEPNHRTNRINDWKLVGASLPTSSARDVTPEGMREAAQGLQRLADEWETTKWQ